MSVTTYQELSDHVGHKMVCVIYAEGENVALECIDCHTVLLNFDRPLRIEGMYSDTGLKEFTVLRPEIHIQPVHIRAKDAETARREVVDGGGCYDEAELEYKETPDPDEDNPWEVVEGNQKYITI